jgi:hypothetical protein
VPQLGAIGGAPQPGDGVVDALQRPVREQGAGSAAMRLFVVAEKVHVDDRQAAADVDLPPDHAKLAQQDGDAHAGGNELQFLDEVLAAVDAAEEIVQREAEFQHHQRADAQEAVQVAQHERADHHRVGRAQDRAPAHGGGAEMRFRRAAGEVVGIGAAACQQRFAALGGMLRLHARGRVGLVHAHHLARLARPE